MDRLVNYFFIFALIGVFVLEARGVEHHQLIVGAFLSTAFCLIAFLLGWLSLDGASASAVLGTIVFGLGGLSVTFLVLFFFLSSTLISKKDVFAMGLSIPDEDAAIRRDGLQVWSNGFWLSVFLFLAYVFDAEIFWVGGISALATATADTWATELGSRRFGTRTWLLNGFREVAPGTDGGVSVQGTLAALAGSIIIAFFSIYLFSLKVTAFFIIFTAGFLGCLADSYFGATYQGSIRSISLPFRESNLRIRVNNNTVNWMATGTGSIMAVILTLVL